jgi:hypothetical protein
LVYETKGRDEKLLIYFLFADQPPGTPQGYLFSARRVFLPFVAPSFSPKPLFEYRFLPFPRPLISKIVDNPFGIY